MNILGKNKLNNLDPTFKKMAESFIEELSMSKELELKGVTDIAIIETKRELAVQMAYYSRSRMSIDDVKKMYKAAGLYAISDAEAKSANTWTLQSKHIEGKALDVVPVKHGTYLWSAPDDIWSIIGKIGKSKGLIWGGDWTNRDLPHFEKA